MLNSRFDAIDMWQLWRLQPVCVQLTKAEADRLATNMDMIAREGLVAALSLIQEPGDVQYVVFRINR